MDYQPGEDVDADALVAEALRWILAEHPDIEEGAPEGVRRGIELVRGVEPHTFEDFTVGDRVRPIPSAYEGRAGTIMEAITGCHPRHGCFRVKVDGYGAAHQCFYLQPHELEPVE